MSLPKILFVAGDVTRLPSVRIRCRDIAERLGSEALYSPMLAEDIPRGYDLYICVKPPMRDEEIQQLCERERVVWDYIDRIPPSACFAASIVSTRAAKAALGLTGTVLHIPHHHCNYERVMASAKPTAVAWIGNKHWYPGAHGLNESVYFVESYDRAQVAECYRRSGIMLNTRRQSCDTQLHIKFNSGIKLINAIGFAIPSVSFLEPAYAEICEASECTVFSDEADVSSSVSEILNHSERYRRMQKECLDLADEYHIDSLVEKYRRTLAAL